MSATSQPERYPTIADRVRELEHAMTIAVAAAQIVHCEARKRWTEASAAGDENAAAERYAAMHHYADLRDTLIGLRGKL